MLAARWTLAQVRAKDTSTRQELETAFESIEESHRRFLPAPRVEDIPEPLRHLTQEALEALRPLEIGSLNTKTPWSAQACLSTESSPMQHSCTATRSGAASSTARVTGTRERLNST